MTQRLLLTTVCLVLVATPALSRSLDLSGESLVAAAPTEMMTAALVVANDRWFPEEIDVTAQRLSEVKEAAWVHYGRGIDLAKWHFEDGRFDGAVMAHIRLTNAFLQRASLDYANLIKANLRGANLKGASLRYADLRQVEGTEVKLIAADLSGADLSRADLRCADLSGSEPCGRAVAKDDAATQTTNPPEPREGRSLAQADAPPPPGQQAATAPSPETLSCKEVSADGKEITIEEWCRGQPRTNLSGANLKGADLTDADLTCAILQGVQMDSKTKFGRGPGGEGTKLKGADFCAADLVGVIFRGAVDAHLAQFPYADLTDATFPDSMTCANLNGAYIDGAHFADPDSKQRTLQQANLSGVKRGSPANKGERLEMCPDAKKEQ